jgi:hypothetical protein
MTLFTKTQTEPLITNCQLQIVRMDAGDPNIDHKPVIKLFSIFRQAGLFEFLEITCMGHKRDSSPPNTSGLSPLKSGVHPQLARLSGVYASTDRASPMLLSRPLLSASARHHCLVHIAQSWRVSLRSTRTPLVRRVW